MITYSTSTSYTIVPSSLFSEHAIPLVPKTLLLCRIDACARHIFQASIDVSRSLQIEAQTLSSSEMLELILTHKNLFISRMNQYGHTLNIPSVRRIVSKSFPQQPSISVLCGSFEQDSDFFIESCQLGSGIEKTVSLILSYPSQPAIKGFAWARYNPSQLAWQASQGIHNPSFEQEYTNSKILKEHQVPYVMDETLITYHPTPETQESSLIMEYCDKGTLNTYLPQITSKSHRMKLCLQVITALSAIHKSSFIHNDLKTNNICVTTTVHGDEIRLTDFATMQELSLPQKLSHASLPTYPPPEMVFQRQQQRATLATTAIDLWALGDIIWYCYSQISLLEKWKLNHFNSQYSVSYDQFNQFVQMRKLSRPFFIERLVLRLFASIPEQRPESHIVCMQVKQWLAFETEKNRPMPSRASTCCNFFKYISMCFKINK